MGFWNQCFRCSERLVCYIKRRKSFFLHLFSGSMTWEYRGYRGLQGVTGGDKGLQGVTKDYRNFFLTRTFPDTFSWSILYKKSKLRKSQIFDQNHGLSPLQKCQFCLLFKSMFILSRKACFLTRKSPNTFTGFILHNTKSPKNFQFLTKTMD